MKTNQSSITPFLWYDGKVEEAVNFYTSIFKNSKIIDVSHLPGEAPGVKGRMMYATFELDGQKFMAIDGGPHYKFTPAISLFVSCNTQEEVDELWEKLSAGGKKDRCGWLQDKYGLSWQIIPKALSELMYSKDLVKSKRVMDAMMKMGKIEIKKLEEAYNEK
jgi:predicted 3-demethylubiquinone-9 3-methyltransferase (glyoxalase superfamily)